MSGYTTGIPAHLVDASNNVVGLVGPDGREWLFPATPTPNSADSGARSVAARVLYDSANTPVGYRINQREFIFGSAFTANTTRGLSIVKRDVLVNSSGVPIGVGSARGSFAFQTAPVEGGGVALRSLFVVSADTGGSGTGSSTGYYTTTATSQRFDGRMQIELLGTGTPGAIKLAFPAFYVDSVTGYASTVGNSFTIDGASIEYGGVNYPLTFNTGSASQVMDSSAPMFYTDPITIPGLTLPATMFVRVGAVVATIGQKFPTSRSRFPSNNTVEGISVNGSIQQAGNTGVIIASGGTLSAYLYGPSAVLAAQPSSGAKAFLVYGGDSIAAGSAETDTVGDGHGNIGFVQRALRGAGYNFATFARGSNQAKFSTSTVVAGSTAATGLYVLAGSVTHGIWQAGTNDINAGATLANLKTWALNGFAAIKAAGAKVIAIKILPRTTSGNIPITTAFDPAGTHIRQDYNTWLDTQVGVTIDYVYDASPLIENGTTGTWANYATDSIDGTHPNLTCDSTKIAPDFQTFLSGVV